MTKTQLLALAPLLALTTTSLVLMLQASVKRSQRAAWYIATVGVLAALWGVVYAKSYAQQVTPLLAVDDWGLFFNLLILFATLVTLFLSRDEFFAGSGRKEEYYLLLILAALGGQVLVHATHVASLLLGLELMGVALYAMIAFPEEGQLPLEAAIKYLVLSACASAMLLFGFALLYAASGDLSFAGMGAKAALAWREQGLLVSVGVGLVLAGLGFKLSVVPFHMWTPDVYQGAPTAVTGFLATVSKGAIFVALSRFFLAGNLTQYQNLMTVLSVLAIASMLLGNLLALQQANVKRLLAYSAIAHFGYLLVVLIAASNTRVPAGEAITFYLTAYIATTLAAFSVAATIGGERDEHYHLEHFRGLFWSRPLQATALTVALLSLAGIPLTAGFVGKFYIISAGIQSTLWGLLTALVAGSAIAIYYYLRVVFVMIDNVGTVIPVSGGRDSGHGIVVAVLMLLVLLMGSWPQPFMELFAAL